MKIPKYILHTFVLFSIFEFIVLTSSVSASTPSNTNSSTLHLEGLLHLYAIVCTIGTVFLGLDKFKEGGTVALISNWTRSNSEKFQAHADTMGFDKNGWPESLPKIVESYVSKSSGVNFDTQPFLLIEYFHLNTHELEKHGKFFERSELKAANKNCGCRMMSFLHKGGFVRIITKLFIISLVFFLALCVVSAFPNLALSTFSKNWITGVEVFLFIWGTIHLLCLIVPALILSKFDRKFDKKIETLWENCLDRMSFLETASGADTEITK